MKKKLFTISVVIATYNSGKTLNKCLECVRKQQYPQGKIDIILGDGGSTDETREIAKKWKATVISIPTDKQHAEYNRGVAYNKAKGDLVLILDHDNFLPNTHWLMDMIAPLQENPSMVATTTCYYDYKKSYSLMDRYFALFGTSEPLPYYLHKTDRMPQTAKNWVLNGNAEDKGKYYLVHFEKDPRKIPSIGTNGCLMRRGIVNRYANVSPDYHYPIDVMVDVIQSGHNEFGFVKNSIIHLTNTRGILSFLQRRIMFVREYAVVQHKKRRWLVYMKGDEFNLVVFIIYSLTWVKPIYDAIAGYVHIRDKAWFIHPLMCFGTVFVYGYVFLREKIRV